MLTIADIKTKMKKNGRNGKLVHTDRGVRSFSREFHLGAIKFKNKKNAEKQILKYIDSEARKWLKTEDYYYSYLFDDNDLLLKYVIHKSNSDDEGTVSKLTPVLLTAGQYFLHDEANYYRFVHRRERNGSVVIEQLIGMAENAQYEEEKLHNLDNCQLEDYPKTLVMRWSLQKPTFNLNLIMSCVFAVTLIASLAIIATGSAAEKARKEQEAAQIQATAKNNDRLKDITQPIEQVWKAVAGQGRIVSIKGDQGNIAFAIVFNKENDARDFIKTNGGVYENGKVVLSASFTGSSKPAGVKQRQ